MKKSASEVIRNLESRVARLEKQSRYGHEKIEFDRDGEIDNPGEVVEAYVNETAVFNDMKDDLGFLAEVEKAGDDPDRVRESDLDFDYDGNSYQSKRDKSVYYFVIFDHNYGWSAIVEMDLEGVETLDDSDVYAPVVWTGHYDDAYKGLRSVGA